MNPLTTTVKAGSDMKTTFRSLTNNHRRKMTRSFFNLAMFLWSSLGANHKEYDVIFLRDGL
jgi:hypothetical protein